MPPSRSPPGLATKPNVRRCPLYGTLTDVRRATGPVSAMHNPGSVAHRAPISAIGIPDHLQVPPLFEPTLTPRSEAAIERRSYARLTCTGSGANCHDVRTRAIRVAAAPAATNVSAPSTASKMKWFPVITITNVTSSG